jgi:protein TonB
MPPHEMLDDWTGKGAKSGARFGASLLASLVVYGSVGAGVVAATAVVRHELAEEEIEISFAPAPEPPPPPPPAPPPPPVAEPVADLAPARLGRARPVLEVPTEIPDEAPPESERPLTPPADPFAPEDEGDPNGTLDGRVGGAPGGTGTVVEVAPPPAPPPAPARPRGPITLPEDAERPRPIHQVEPEIPAELRSAGVPQVRIVLRVTLDEEGNVTDVAVLRGHPLMPDENVIRAVRSWRFSPARVGGEAIAAIITLPVTFRVSL